MQSQIRSSAEWTFGSPSGLKEENRYFQRGSASNIQNYILNKFYGWISMRAGVSEFLNRLYFYPFMNILLLFKPQILLQTLLINFRSTTPYLSWYSSVKYVNCRFWKNSNKNSHSKSQLLGLASAESCRDRKKPIFVRTKQNNLYMWLAGCDSLKRIICLSKPKSYWWDKGSNFVY